MLELILLLPFSYGSFPDDLKCDVISSSILRYSIVDLLDQAASLATDRVIRHRSKEHHILYKCQIRIHTQLLTFPRAASQER